MSTLRPAPGLTVLSSGHAVDELIARLKQMLQARGLRVFAEIDFSADAAACGLTLRPTRMLVAGNPKAGTPLIEASPSIAIDLPLKVLVWAEDGQTRVAFNDPHYLVERHAVPEDLTRNIAGFGALVEQVAAGGP